MASHRHTYRAGEAKGQAQIYIYIHILFHNDKTNQVMYTIGQKRQEVKDNTHETAQAAKGRTKGATQTTRDKGQEKGEVTKAKKASEVGQKAKDTAGAAKEKSEGFLQQTGEKAKNMAQTTAEAVKNTFGMAKDDEEEDLYVSLTLTITIVIMSFVNVDVFSNYDC
ncbi:unnamed protein product [Malus baccata var. baccata]